MTTKRSVARNWRDIEPKSSADANVYQLIDRVETEYDHLDVSLIEIKQWRTFHLDPVQGEFFIYVLSGHGILTWPMDDTEQPYMLDSDVFGWMPASREFAVENTGEALLRLLKVTVKNEAEYASRAGDIGKLTPSDHTHHKVYDDIHYFDLSPPKRLLLGAYQVFTPSRRQGEHVHKEEVIYAVRGTATLVSNDEEFEIDAGTAAYTPAGVYHQLISESTDRFGYIVLECS